jgi:hypothetical protein
MMLAVRERILRGSLRLGMGSGVKAEGNQNEGATGNTVNVALGKGTARRALISERNNMASLEIFESIPAI